MNELTTTKFSNSEYLLFSINVNDEPYFIVNEVCSYLKHSNPSKAVKNLCDPEDVFHLTYNEASSLKITSSYFQNIGVKGLTLVNESGMYSLILGSKLPEAKKFKRWVTSEVLPSIRKNGMYATESKMMEYCQMAVNEPDKLVVEILKCMEDLKKQKQYNSMLEGDSLYLKKILDGPDLMLVRDWCKDYGFTSTTMNAWLVNKGICGRVIKSTTQDLFPKQPYDKMNLMKSSLYKGTSRLVYKWTQTGRKYIHIELSKLGIKALEECKDEDPDIVSKRNKDLLMNDMNVTEETFNEPDDLFKQLGFEF